MNTEIIGGIVDIDDVEAFIKMLNEVAKKHRVIVQAIDANQIASRDHILFAVEKASRAMREGRNIAKDLGLEILLYASGKRQIEQAMSMGVHSGKNYVAIVIIGDDTTGASSELKTVLHEAPVLDYTECKKRKLVKTFDITEAEINAVGDDKIPELVLERVALLDIMK
ncbi:MAG: KEOPS complex subunit Cgi121 [Methanocellales archaeon]|nr:KEOPS complex subunit Cgi121 [Methanocellales archaeon]MDD3291102.1 KEOPS complex subunit Cgi121 [Methanocellales archaeon]MDD5234987.1 KEOPS complex subunit Cgi121 [Methanocellales archaeon]MDD5484642.1 KEOPS complex subunit Cgi121 [Methanocellales archaeon]